MHSPNYPEANMLLPDVINFNMINNSDQPFFTFSDSEKRVQVITHLEFGRAVHRVAHELRPGGSKTDGEVVAIMAQIDTVLYHAIVAGLILAGLVPFPISPRNTPAAVAELLVKTSCHRLLTTDALSPLTEDVTTLLADAHDFHELLISGIPLLSTAYPQLAQETAEHAFQPYPAPSRRPSLSDTCLFLHSSGSTGNPKAIAQTHLHWMQAVTSPELKRYVPRLVLGCMALPTFHAAGIGLQLFVPAYGIVSIAVFPPMTGTPGASPVIPSPDSVLKHAKATNTNAIFIIPLFIQVWVSTPGALDYLKSLEFLGYTGGPLPPKLGNHLAASDVRLNPIYGGTETGAPTCLVREKGEEQDWEYMRFFEHTKIRWVPQGDGTYECQFLACETHRPVVFNLPDVEGYATADIFEPHPTKDGLWKIVGRLDDVIIHSSGEKTVPGPMEVIIMSNPLAHGVIMFGRERDQTGVLIELRPGTEIDVNDQEKVTLLRNQLWPTIEEANEVAPAFSKIYKEMILIASKEKPLPRAGKGTVMRKAALNLYAPEIAALYENVQLSIATEHSHPDSWQMSDVESWLLKQAIELTSGKHISPSADLFEQGFDRQGLPSFEYSNLLTACRSLSATILRLRIVDAMRSSGHSPLKQASRNVAQNLVYNAPTIDGIAAYIVSCSKSQGGSVFPSPQGTDTMEAFITKYSAGLGPSSPQNPISTILESERIVLLTGSTGHLGSQILAKLLQDDRINMVYAFNRPGLASTTLLDRHLVRFKDIGIDSALLESKKLVFIAGDATQSGLGIDEQLYKEISSSVNVVIHNAWQLDFNLRLPSYEPNIQSSRHLIDLIKAGSHATNARFLFISSVASAQSWNDSLGPVPEDLISDASSALGGGYGESKYVVERVLANGGLQATALRVGQVSGGLPKGSWPTTEWFPILVKSSVTLGIIPELHGSASWLPADTIATTVLELALSSTETPLPRVLNLVHPQPVDYKIIIDAIVKGLSETLSHNLKPVPLKEWVSTVAEIATSHTLTSIPAIKLIQFFRESVGAEVGSRVFATEKIQSVSSSLHPENLRQLGENDARLWLEYWLSVGYLSSEESR